MIAITLSEQWVRMPAFPTRKLIGYCWNQNYKPYILLNSFQYFIPAGRLFTEFILLITQRSYAAASDLVSTTNSNQFLHPTNFPTLPVLQVIGWHY